MQPLPDNPALGAEAASTGVLVGVRPVIDPQGTALGATTPLDVASALVDAASLQRFDRYYRLAERMEEADGQIRSLMTTRKTAAALLDVVVEAASASSEDLAIAAFCQEVLTRDFMPDVLMDMTDALMRGTSVLEIEWRYGTTWEPGAITWRDTRHFAFAEDGRAPVVRVSETETKALSPGKFIVHQPRTKSGLPIRAGLARPLAMLWLFKALNDRAWAVFNELHASPQRIGKYAPGQQSEDAIAKLKAALRGLATDAAAVIPESMKIELLEANRLTSVETYERRGRWLDEQIAKLILGQTLTSSDGKGRGSYALGQVHNEVRQDLVHADARQLAATLRRDLVRPLVRFNFGPDARVPQVRLRVDEPQDLIGLASVLEKLSPVMDIPESWARDRFGIPAPKDGEPVLGRGTRGT